VFVGDIGEWSLGVDLWHVYFGSEYPRIRGKERERESIFDLNVFGYRGKGEKEK